MGELCQKCGATLSPGLCSICEREELRAEIKRLQKLLKMAEDELIESDNHGRAQAKRADVLEAENEQLKEELRKIQELYDDACYQISTQ